MSVSVSRASHRAVFPIQEPIPTDLKQELLDKLKEFAKPQVFDKTSDKMRDKYPDAPKVVSISDSDKFHQWPQTDQHKSKIVVLSADGKKHTLEDTMQVSSSGKRKTAHFSYVEDGKRYQYEAPVQFYRATYGGPFIGGSDPYGLTHAAKLVSVKPVH